MTERRLELYRQGLAIGLVTLWTVPVALAGPNLVAVGNYDEIPFTRAEGRVSHAGKEVVFSFDDPRLDFGRVVVRSNQPLSVVKRDLFVGYNGNGLVIDTRPGGRGSGAGQTQISQLEVWLRLNGAMQGERSYGWELELFAESDIEGGVPAVIPMFWADGEQYGSDVQVVTPEPEDTDRIQRLMIPHGVVEVPQFQHQTGTAWIVLKPERYGQGFRVARASFREIDKDVAADRPSEMPVPVRYTPIRSVLEDQVSEAFDRSVEVLKNLQGPDGFWNGGGGENDVRATSVIAFVLSLFDRNSEGIKRAHDWLVQQQPADGQNWNVTTVAARLTCLAASPRAKDYDATLRKDLLFLTEAQLDDGGWGERSAVESTGLGSQRSSHPATLQAMSALAVARLAGVEPDSRVWKNALQYWTAAQTYGGGFSDRTPRFGGVGQIATSAYTAIGATGLIGCMDMAFAAGGRRCSGYTAATNQLRATDAALAWLEKRYGAENRFAAGSLPIAADPGLEPLAMIALGTTCGLPSLNGKNYFRESATALLEHFDEASAMFGIRGPNGGFAVAPNPERTATVLAGLATGNAPIVVQRIIVGDDEKGWAQYRSDATHLAQYLGSQRGSPFNWRRTTLDREIRELVEVPILVLSVVGTFDWTPDQWQKIREYCLSGGSVVVDVAPDAEGEREKIEKAVRETFPEYQLSELPPDAAVLNADGARLNLTGLKAIGNGFRHFLFLPSESWSCHWHLYEVSNHADSFAFIDNLLTYATDGSPPRSVFAGSTYAVPSASSKQLTAARVQIGGSTPAYPNLIETMSRLMQSNYRLAVQETSDPTAADLVWVEVVGDAAKADHGAERMLAAARAGKFVLVDVVSGNSDWDESFQAMIKSLDTGLALEKLPRSNPMFTGMIPGTQGFDVVEAPMRKALHTRFSKTGRCDLYVILLDGKPVGVYSAHDLSSGIGFHQFPGCRGPMPEEARKVAMNAFLAAYARKLGAGAVQ